MAERISKELLAGALSDEHAAVGGPSKGARKEYNLRVIYSTLSVKEVSIL